MIILFIPLSAVIGVPLLVYMYTVYVISITLVLSWSIHQHSFIAPPYLIGVQSELLLTQSTLLAIQLSTPTMTAYPERLPNAKGVAINKSH